MTKKPLLQRFCEDLDEITNVSGLGAGARNKQTSGGLHRSYEVSAGGAKQECYSSSFVGDNAGFALSGGARARSITHQVMNGLFQVKPSGSNRTAGNGANSPSTGAPTQNNSLYVSHAHCSVQNNSLTPPMMGASGLIHQRKKNPGGMAFAPSNGTVDQGKVPSSNSGNSSNTAHSQSSSTSKVIKQRWNQCKETLVSWADQCKLFEGKR